MKTPVAPIGHRRTTCLICEAENPSQTTQCRECAAPMSLFEDAAVHKRDPQIVTILGDSNAGKTVYLGFLLDMLSQEASDFDAIPKASFAVELQQRVVSYMAHRMFPPKTPVESNEWSWAYYEIRRSQRSSKCMDLLMPDLAGEAIAAELSAPLTFKVVRNLMCISSGVLLVVDASLAASGSPQPDFFGLKVLGYIESLYGPQSKRSITLPIAVVLSKADCCPSCLDDPRRFAEANCKRLWNLCRRRFSRVEFFASSVVGSLGYAAREGEDDVRPIPLHTAVRGVLEPFEWIAKQLNC